MGFDYPGFVGLDVTAMRGVNTSVYVRVPFYVEDDTPVTRLTLRMKYEDGFVAYLNGHEVARANAPAGTEPAWNASATANRPDSEAVEFADFDISPQAHRLVAGDNVLALQVLNIDLISSDLLALPELVAVRVHAVDLSDVFEGYLLQPPPGAPNHGALAQIGPGIQNVTENPPPPNPGEDLVITAQISQTRASVLGSSWNGDRFRPGQTIHGQRHRGHGGRRNRRRRRRRDGVYTAVIPSQFYVAGDVVGWSVSAIDAEGQISRAPLFLRPNDSPQYFGTVVRNPGSETSLPVLYWFSEQPARTRTRAGGRASVFFDGQFYDNVFVRERGAYTTGGSQKFVFNRGHRFRFSPDHERVRSST